MRVFKPIIAVGGGRKQATAWYVSVQAPDGRWRSIRGFTDKRMTADLGCRIEALVARRVNKEAPDGDLAAWVEGLTPYLRKRLDAIGAMDPRRVAAGKRLTEHLADWRRHLETKSCAPRYVTVAVAAVRGLADAAGMRFLSDIQPDRVEAHLAGLRADRVVGGEAKRGRSDRTRNSHLASIRAFCRWAVFSGRLTADPVARVRAIREEPCRVRRALAAEEVRLLLAATAKEPARYGLTGLQRALVYRVAIETGLRVSELRSLTAGSFDLDGTQPTVTVEARHSKRRRRDTLPVRRDTAETLRAHLAGKLPAAPALAVPSSNRTARMLREDATAAGLDLAGLDFHSLRHTCASLLAAAGVHPRTAQSILRHSDINLTMSRYSHVLVEQESAAVAALPDLAAPPSQAARATGTDDAPARKSFLAPPLRQRADFGAISANSGELKGPAPAKAEDAQEPQDVAETREFSRNNDASDVERAMGFEPTTFSLGS